MKINITKVDAINVLDAIENALSTFGLEGRGFDGMDTLGEFVEFLGNQIETANK